MNTVERQKIMDYFVENVTEKYGDAVEINEAMFFDFLSSFSEERCRWTIDSDGYWRTECNETYAFLTVTTSDTASTVEQDTPFEDGSFRFCPYCGRKIEVEGKV